MHASGLVKARHEGLRERYREAPSDAWIRDRARTVYDQDGDPFHGVVRAGEHDVGEVRFGIHGALGGDHDLPNPGDILCAALAACLDATLRMIADRLAVPIRFLEVCVTGELDARGPLKLEPAVPAGFQSMTCQVTLEPGGDAGAPQVAMLVAAAEQCCVVLNTLRNGVRVVTHVERRATATVDG
jgi:uncharacterized OsmC-like protein